MPKPQTSLIKENYSKYFAAILFIVSIVLYSNTFKHGFVLDDEAVITKNKFVQNGFGGLKNILTTFYWQGYWSLNSGLYRPLSLIVFALEWQLVKNNALFYHFIQVLVYAFAVVLLYNFLKAKLLASFSKNISFAIALLFAVHPMHTEVVANIKSLDEILHFIFLIAALWYVDGETVKAKMYTLVFFVLALLAKESGLLFIPIAALYLIQVKQKKWQVVAKQFGFIYLAAAIWLCIRAYVIYKGPALVGYTHEDNSLLACNNWLTQKFTAIYLLLLYLIKFLYPANLSYDYSFNQIPCITIGNWQLWCSLFAIACLLYVAIKNFRKNALLSFGIFFFFITSSLTSNIFIIIGTTMADRLMFTPYLGLLLAVLIYSNGFNFLQKKLLLLVGVISLFFGVNTFSRNNDWESNATLFEADAKPTSNSARVHYNYGTVLLNASNANYTLALQQLQKAYTINPTNTNILANVGVAFYKTKQYNNAIDFLRKYIAAKPEDDYQKLNIADAFVKVNLFDSAIYYYNNALNKNVYQPNTHNYLGTAYFSIKQYNNAEKIFEKGLTLYPNNEELLMNLGNVLAVQKKHDDAIKTFLKIITINPNAKQAFYYLAMVYNEVGNKQLYNDYLQKYNSLK